MRHVLLVILLVFLAATRSLASGLPDIESARAPVLLHTEYGNTFTQHRAGEASDKCCMEELIKKSTSQSPCSTDCTYLLIDVEMLFSGCPERHDSHDRDWRAVISCHTLLRPPIV